MTMLSSRRGYGPFLWGVVVYASLLGAWEGCLAGHMPETPMRIDMQRGKIVWVGERIGPYYSNQELQRAELLIIGDSRVHNAILAEPFEQAGLGRTAVLWGGGAQLTEMLPALRALPCRRVVVALSPLSVYTTTDPLLQELLRNPVPDIAPPNLAGKLARWKSSERAHLLQAGYQRHRIDLRLADFENMLREQVRPPWKRALDARLAHWVDVRRQRLLRTLEPELWETSWFYPIDASTNNEVYKLRLRPKTHAQRSRNLNRIETLLRELESEGRALVAVRLPLAPELLAIEESGLPSQAFTRLCDRAEIPFLDYSRRDFTTRDGSHLTGPSARRFSRDLARDLLELWN